MNMRRNASDTYVPTAAGLPLLEWFLLWARSYEIGRSGVTEWVCWILTFPWSILYFWVEAERNLWWHRTFGTRFEAVFNDEFGPLLLFLFIGLPQAATILGNFLRLKDSWGGKPKAPDGLDGSQSKNAAGLTDLGLRPARGN